MKKTHDTIAAQSRLAGGKGIARKVRRLGQVPAVVYGPKGAPRAVALCPKAFLAQRFAYGTSHLYSLEVDEKDTVKVLIKDLQVDAVTQKLLHVDFYAVDLEKPLRVEVPIVLRGKPAGAIDGGLLTQILRKVSIQCLPEQIPTELVGDVTSLQIGQSLHLRQLPLPKGAKLLAHGEDPVAAVVEPEGAASEGAKAEAAAPGADKADGKK